MMPYRCNNLKFDMGEGLNLRNEPQVPALSHRWRQIGPLATEILAEAAAVLHVEGTIDEMMNMMRAHPTGLGRHERRLRIGALIADLMRSATVVASR